MSSDNRRLAFDTNEYVRPNDNWRCGGALDGLPCTRGPNGAGECGATCVPFKIGERYYCNNAAKLCGRCDDGPLPDGRCSHDPPECTPVQGPGGYVCNRGACTDGPLPDGSCSRQLYVCQPVRTVKSQRWLVTTSVFGAAVGLALLAIGGPGRQAAVSPGNVASVHQAVADDCSACHHVGAAGAIEIVDASVSGHTAIAENELCLRCHQEFAEHDRMPHTTSAEFLAVNSDATQRGDLLVEATRAIFHAPEELACASCHREHHGADNDLTEIADRKCHLCHTNRFHSFSADHPPFTDYPLSRRSEIYFDHASHYGGHFANYSRTAPDGSAPGSREEIAAASSVTCEQCHTTDDSGAYMLSLGYQAACASCHDGQIWDLATPAMPVLSLRPPVKTERPAFQPWGLESGPYDLPPVMRMLLAGDERYVDAYAELHAMGWQSAAAAGEAESSKTERLTEVMFDLLKELADDPRGTIAQRMTKVGGDRLTPAQIQKLARTTATASFVAGVRQMADELANERTAGAGTEASSPTQPSSDRAGSPATGWTFDERSGMLSYRPREHADSVMREWTDAAAAILAADYFERTAATNKMDEPDAVQSAAGYFVGPIAAGRCVKCHTVDQAADRMLVNWHARHHAVGREELTFFRHAPHIVMLPGQDQCITCHQLQAQDAMFRPEFFAAGNRVKFDSSPGASCGFPQISGAVACASCHHSTGASQRCTTCHHYHARQPASSGSRSLSPL